MKTGKQNPAYRHGMTNTKTYRTWGSMMARCYIKSATGYKNYGARNIRVCESWHDFSRFYADMGAAPEDKSLERINNAGNYEPHNCKWATRTEQNNNSRHNLTINIDGEIKTVKQWAIIKKIPYPTLLYRVNKGWPTQNLFDKPSFRGRAVASERRRSVMVAMKHDPVLE